MIFPNIPTYNEITYLDKVFVVIVIKITKSDGRMIPRHIQPVVNKELNYFAIITEIHLIVLLLLQYLHHFYKYTETLETGYCCW